MVDVTVETLGGILRVDYPGVTDSTVEALLASSSLVEVKRNEFLVEQGRKSYSLFFIIGGLFRGVHVADGQEDTLFFGVAGDPFLSVHSFAHDQRAQISLQALEDSAALAVPYSDFRGLLVGNTDLLQWWSHVLLEQIYALERRYAWLGACNARQRYETLLKVRSGIIDRIPLKYVAQYIGVTPEYLSRIRAKVK